MRRDQPHRGSQPVRRRCARAGVAPFPLIVGCLVLLTLAAAATPARAQAGADSAKAAEEAAEREHPMVRRVVFKGADHVEEGQLQLRIATKPSSCRTFLLKPFCLLSKSHIIYQRNHLDRRELKRDELRLRVYYYKKGYRSAEVASHVVPPNGETVDVIFDITEGPVTRVASLTVTKADTVIPPLTARNIKAARLPQQGAALDLFALDSAKVRLLGTLRDRGYADAKVRDTTELGPRGLSAAVRVTIDPGERATVAGLDIRGNKKVSDRTVRHMMTLHAGDLYRRSDALDSQRKLYQSGLFRMAIVDVPPQQDTAKTVRVVVREAPLHDARASVGFNTVDFVQVQGRYTDQNWFGGARQLNVTAAVGNLLASQLNGRGIFRDVTPPRLTPGEEGRYLQPTWQASVSATQPYVGSPQNTLGLSVFAHRSTIPGIVVDRGQGASVSFTRRIARDIPTSLEYHFELNRLEAGGVYFCVDYGVCDQATIGALQGQQRLAPLGFSLFTDRVDQPLEPSHGYRLRLDLEHASSLTYSSFRYNRASLELARYLPRGNGRVLAAHLRYGFVRPLASTNAAVGVPTVGNLALIHPRKRFYAGGARSVRGYGENQLGPRVLTIPPAALMDSAAGCTEATLRDGSCDPNAVPSTSFTPRPLGGDALLEGSIEYRMPLSDALLAAVFVDAGAVGTDGINPFRAGKSAVTPGIGIRYLSKIGPIRVDLGLHPTGAERLPVITQVQQPDGTFKLVRLAQPKLYDPLEGSGGIARLLNRLTLHLSIGEAF